MLKIGKFHSRVKLNLEDIYSYLSFFSSSRFGSSPLLGAILNKHDEVAKILRFHFFLKKSK